MTNPECHGSPHEYETGLEDIAEQIKLGKQIKTFYRIAILLIEAGDPGVTCQAEWLRSAHSMKAIVVKHSISK